MWKHKVVAIDYDGTLVENVSPDTNGKLIKDADKVTRKLKNEGWEIIIFTCRFNFQKKELEENLRKQDITYDYIAFNSKPVASLYIDDKGFRFNGDWDEVYSFIQLMETMEGYIDDREHVHEKFTDIEEIVSRLREDKTLLLNKQESLTLYEKAYSVNNIAGDLAEVGVGKGGSAKLISLANKNNKPFHLFDTFKGLPKTEKIDTKAGYKTGDYKSKQEDVEKLLKFRPNIHIHKGVFPNTTNQLKDKRYCFVHFDGDLYRSAKDTFAYFYPKMSPGAILVAHNYRSLSVRRACDEFFENKKEKMIPCSADQCFFVKR